MMLCIAGPIVLILSFLSDSALGQGDIVLWAQKGGKYQEWLKQLNQDEPRYKNLIETLIFPITVFIPEDEAFQKFAGQSTKDLIGTHIVVGAYDADSLVKLSTLSCLDASRPKLRFTKGYNATTGGSYTYVLNAKLLESRKFGESMVHIIDRVLNPPKLQQGLAVAPNGLEWINYNNYYPSLPVKDGVTTFSYLINQTGTQSMFDCLACTFFVPERIDGKIQNLLDRNVLLAHVIPDHVLFFRSMNESTPYKTRAASDELSVELTKEVRIMRGFEKSYIYSHTKGNTKSIHLGRTRVKITQPDIPVSNGVIHIIDKPLVITDISILDYLNEEGASSLQKFFSLLQQHSSLKSIYSRGDATRPLTLFAFSNEAYEAVNDDIMMISRNQTSIEELLKLHFVDDAKITSQNGGTIKEKPSLSANKKLYFSVDQGKLYVEGEGVKAAAVVQDIACTNGVIHVINKVLGIPSSPIKDKLREDPQLKTTFTVASKIGPEWLERLGDKSKNFTFFAPSEAAWEKLKAENPSAYKQLVAGLYKENTQTILNRHLAADRAIPSDMLTNERVIETVNSRIHIENMATSGEHGIVLKYMQLRAHITRPDIKAINGIIHEIDTVLMQDVDLQVAPAMVRTSASSRSHINSLSILLAIIILLKF